MELHYTCASEQTDLTREEGNKLVVSFEETTRYITSLSSFNYKFITELDHALSDGVSRVGRQALEWRASTLPYKASSPDLRTEYNRDAATAAKK
ncbi:unnamed protein product [Prunus armeniaca]